MENFLFSLNVTLPIFIIIVVGGFLQRIGLLNEGFTSVADKFVFKVALPVQLFRDIATMDIRSDFSGKFVVFCMIATTCMFAFCWLIGQLFLRDKSMVGAFAQASAPRLRRNSRHRLCGKHLWLFRYDTNDDRSRSATV